MNINLARIAELEERHYNECAQIAHYDDELSEAKRLLKLAVEDMEQANQKGRCSTCFYNHHNAKGLIGKCQACHDFSLWKWRNEAEAIRAIGGNNNG